MTMATKAKKTFSGSGKKKATAKPIVLPLEDASGELVNIEAYPVVSGWATLQFVRGISSEESGESMGAVQEYIEASFDAKNKKEFLAVVEDPANGFEIQDIVEILSSLLEQRADDRDFEESSE